MLVRIISDRIASARDFCAVRAYWTTLNVVVAIHTGTAVLPVSYYGTTHVL
jgi:hypothetical protein